MKIAITSGGEGLEAPFDTHFGRAPYFVLIDLDGGGVESIDNSSGVEAAQGAGPRAAELLFRAGVKAVVTGHCGPKATDALDEAKIVIYNTVATSVAEALEQYRSGALQPIITQKEL